MLNKIEDNVIDLIFGIVVGTNKMNEINNINILVFRGIVFNFIKGKNFKGFVKIRIGNFDFDIVGSNKEIGVKIEKIKKLIVSHMVSIFFNNGQIIFFHKNPFFKTNNQFSFLLIFKIFNKLYKLKNLLTH